MSDTPQLAEACRSMEGLGSGADWQTMTIALHGPEVSAKAPRNYSLHCHSHLYGCGNDGNPGAEPNSGAQRHCGGRGRKCIAKHKNWAKRNLSNTSGYSIYAKHDVEPTLYLQYAHDFNLRRRRIRLCQHRVIGRFQK